jgi:hypothetical protein
MIVPSEIWYLKFYYELKSSADSAISLSALTVVVRSRDRAQQKA